VRKAFPLSARISFVLLSVILFLYAVIAAREFLYPIVLGILFGYLLIPVAQFLEKYRFPRIAANLMSILLLLIVATTAIILIYKQAGGLVEDIPLYKQRALANIDKVEELIENKFGVSDLRLVEYLRVWTASLFETGNTVVNRAFASTAGTVFRIGLLPVYIFLFLYYRTKLATFILQMVPSGKKINAIRVLKEFSYVVPRYMGGVTTVVLILCVINSIGLLIVGLDHWLLFGIISALCNFIPYFGTLIGGAIPLLFAVISGESFLLPVRVLILFIIIQFTENNILTPNIVGSSLRLNPMVIIIGIIGGGMVWGIPGMFAIVPLLAMVNIMSENIPAMHPYSYLLGVRGTRRHAITFENIRRFFSRIKKRFNS
jgi:predicted PurR-regulated permease PerM